MREEWLLIRARVQWLWWDKEVHFVLEIRRMMLAVCLGMLTLAISASAGE